MKFTKAQLDRAKRLYADWFKNHPNIKNPSDVNREEKYDHAMQIGWEDLKLMQSVRKENKRENGYPYPWTKGESE